VARLNCLVLPLALLGCGRLEHECRSLTTTANAFILASEEKRLPPEASPAETARAAVETASRYERLAADLSALNLESKALVPEVTRYRELALGSAASLRAVAKALDGRDFETARKKRVEFDLAARGEAPIVARINAVCTGTPLPATSR
jgi:hypothetical protein